MEIKTKYNIGDEVFFMYDNEITTGKIKMVQTVTDLCYNGVCTQVEYYIPCGSYTGFFKESFVFKTKQELINSL